jgi:hypothetical protein
MGECMGAIDDVELYGDTTMDGTRTIMARNTTKDKTVAIGVHIGGACKEKTFDATLKPMGHVHVASEAPGDTMCHYEIDSASYVV